MKMPAGLEYWTADEVAECVSGIPDSIYKKLWGFVAEAKNPTPCGGDPGEQPGTVETPEERLDLRNDDKAGHWWKKLEPEEQAIIAACFKLEYPNR